MTVSCEAICDLIEKFIKHELHQAKRGRHDPEPHRLPPLQRRVRRHERPAHADPDAPPVAVAHPDLVVVTDGATEAEVVV